MNNNQDNKVGSDNNSGMSFEPITSEEPLFKPIELEKIEPENSTQIVNNNSVQSSNEMNIFQTDETLNMNNPTSNNSNYVDPVPEIEPVMPEVSNNDVFNSQSSIANTNNNQTLNDSFVNTTNNVNNNQINNVASNEPLTSTFDPVPEIEPVMPEVSNNDVFNSQSSIANTNNNQTLNDSFVNTTNNVNNNQINNVANNEPLTSTFDPVPEIEPVMPNSATNPVLNQTNQPETSNINTNSNFEPIMAQPNGNVNNNQESLKPIQVEDSDDDNSGSSSNINSMTNNSNGIAQSVDNNSNIVNTNVNIGYENQSANINLNESSNIQTTKPLNNSNLDNNNIFGQPITSINQANKVVNRPIVASAPLQVETPQITEETIQTSKVNNQNNLKQPINSELVSAPPISTNEEIDTSSLAVNQTQGANVNDMYVATGPVEKNKPRYGRTDEEIKEQENEKKSKSSIRFLIIIAIFLLLIILFLPKISDLIIQVIEMIKG